MLNSIIDATAPFIRNIFVSPMLSPANVIGRSPYCGSIHEDCAVELFDGSINEWFRQYDIEEFDLNNIEFNRVKITVMSAQTNIGDNGKYAINIFYVEGPFSSFPTKLKGLFHAAEAQC